MQDGLALKEVVEPRMGVPDFPGDTIDTIGQTFHYETVGSKMIDVLKCEGCGHSVSKTTKQIHDT